MRVGSVLVTFFLAFLLTGCTSQAVRENDKTGTLGAAERRESPADTYVQLAAEYLRIGNYAAALSKAKKAVQKDPRNANAYLVLGLVYEKLGEPKNALDVYRRGVNVDGRDPYLLNAYGVLLCEQNQYQQSQRMFDRALSNPLYDTPWVALTNAGHCALRAGEKDKATHYLLKALQANPKYAPALENMAQISYDQGKYLSARAYVERFREVAKVTPKILYLSILTERRLGDENQVKSDELLLRSRFPDSEEAHKIAR